VSNISPKFAFAILLLLASPATSWARAAGLEEKESVPISSIPPDLCYRPVHQDVNLHGRPQKNKLEFRRPTFQGGTVFGRRREIVRVAHGSWRTCASDDADAQDGREDRGMRLVR